jgi:hypothetical protein
MHIKLLLETCTETDQLKFQLDENRAQLWDFVRRVGNPETRQFLAHPNEDSRQIVIEGSLWNLQL